MKNSINNDIRNLLLDLGTVLLSDDNHRLITYSSKIKNYGLNNLQKKVKQLSKDSYDDFKKLHTDIIDEE